MENRFLEMDLELRGISARGRASRPASFATRSASLTRSYDWERSLSAAQRVLVILIENGGVDLGIPELVDKILAVLPGSSVIPDSLRQQLVEFIRQRIKSFTDNLLESAELALNRYSAAKPDLYADVVLLRNGTAAYADLKNQLIALSKAGKIIDLFILTHGGKDRISLLGPDISGDDIRKIKSEYGKPLSIRAVYMMNCVGSSLNGAWLDAGARVSSGSRGNNYLPEPTMYFFWQNWKAGQSFESAVTSAYASTVKLMNEALQGFLRTLSIPAADLLFGSFDFASCDFVQESAPVIDGQRSLTIGTDDLSFGQSTSTGMATTVVPVRALGDADAAAGKPTGVSEAGVEFVKGWEGFSADLYNDEAGHCTVGYGCLVHHGNCDGRQSEQPYVSGISKEEAKRLLARELAEKQAAVSDCVKVALNQNQYDALISFAYNVGAANFKRSTLLKLLNQGKYDAVPGELKKWTKAHKDGKVIELKGLANRRAAEAALFQKPVAAASQSLSALPLGSYGRALSQAGAIIPVRHSSSYRSPSLISAAQSGYSLQQNPAALVAGIEIADAIQIGLAGISVLQTAYGVPEGSFALYFDKCARLLTPDARVAMPGSQSSKKSYSMQLFYIGSSSPVVDFAYASVIIEWEGNAYGEIGTPMIRRDIKHSSDWSRSSNTLTISRRETIPLPKTDPRAWPITFTYEGSYDPVGNGYFEYSGEFEVNAFGGLKFNRHDVVSRSLVDWAISGKPEDYVRKGTDVIVPVPDIPKEQLAYLKTKLP